MLFVLAGGLLIARPSSAQCVQLTSYQGGYESASGTFGPAFTQCDSSYIGCSVSAQPGVAPSIMCFAQSQGGGLAPSGSCYSNDPNIVRVVNQLTTDSYLFFEWDSTGYCQYVEVDEYSNDPPK